MTDSAYSPAGFCPFCGHAIDPGICSECGRDVSPTALDAEKDQTRHKRRKRNLWRLVAIILVLTVGYTTLRNIEVKSRLPVSWLLTLDRWGGNWAWGELWSRYRDGRLSPGEASEMLKQKVEISPVSVLSPHPAKHPITFRVRLDSKGSFFGLPWELILDSWRVEVDGAEVSCSDSHRRGGGVNHWVEEYRVRIGPLVPGEHRIAVFGQCTLRPDRGTRGGTIVPPTFPISEAFTVEIQDGPLEGFVRPVWSDHLAQEVKKRITASVGAKPGSGPELLLLVSDSSPVPIAGYIYGRRVGDVEYVRLSKPVIFDANVPASFTLFPTDLADVKHATRLDLRFEPDPTVALESGFRTFFNGVSEWPDIEFTSRKTPGGTELKESHATTVEQAR